MACQLRFERVASCERGQLTDDNEEKKGSGALAIANALGMEFTKRPPLIGPLQSIQFSSGFIGLSTNIGSLLIGPNSALVDAAKEDEAGGKDWFPPLSPSRPGPLSGDLCVASSDRSTHLSLLLFLNAAIRFLPTTRKTIS